MPDNVSIGLVYAGVDERIAIVTGGAATPSA
jgi:hypothetical protein